MSSFSITALISLFIGALSWAYISRWMARVSLRRRFHRGLKAEAKAEKILNRFGYRLVSEQSPETVCLYVDGKECKYQIRPDGLASRKGRLYAVEVKSGVVATDPLFRETRRQLMEYYYSLPVDGVLLVNADLGSVVNVAFEEAENKSYVLPIAMLILGLILGILL